MLVFNNQQRSGYEEITSYGPGFYRDIKEMDAIYRFGGWTCDLMATDLENLVAMQFIKYMNDEALTRYEQFIGINKDYTNNLDERKNIVLAQCSSSGKISKTKIQTIVNSFAECKCQVSMEGANIIVDMMFKGDPAKYMSHIREILQKSIPAHIGIVYRGSIDLSIVFKLDNKVSVQRIINKMIFRMSNSKKHMYLDGSAYRMKIENAPKDRFSVFIKNNLYYLDGSELINGNRRLNAYVKQEEL